MATVDLMRYKRIVQYFWDPEPKNDENPQVPIWCLGEEFQPIAKPAPKSTDVRTLAVPRGETVQESDWVVTETDSHLSGEDRSVGVQNEQRKESGTLNDGGWPPDFVKDFEAKFWFTYRSNFPPIPKSSDLTAPSTISLSIRLRNQFVDQGAFTADTGWGCMIRSGQCLLANALGILRLGRGWKRGVDAEKEQRLLALFADDSRASFSIHNFVEHGAYACGKHPGEWFGPSATASCIKALSERHAKDELQVYATKDGADVYEDSVLSLARERNGTFQPVLILVGIRLGIDRVTPVYHEALKASLKLPQSLGIAGGRPSSSHYFVGVQEDSFFYLDPHQTRPALPYYEDCSSYTIDEIDSCHTKRLRRLHIKDMDPSMLIAYLIRDEEDWQKWKQAISLTAGKAVVHVADTDPNRYKGSQERQDAVDEVEILDDDEEEGEMVDRPES